MNKDRKRIERDRRLIMEMIDASFELAEKKGVMILNQAVTVFHASINESGLLKIPEKIPLPSGFTLFDLMKRGSDNLLIRKFYLIQQS